VLQLGSFLAGFNLASHAPLSTQMRYCNYVVMIAIESSYEDRCNYIL
jgi:hypothetical protein